MSAQDKVIAYARRWLRQGNAKDFLGNAAQVAIADLATEAANATAREFDPSGERAMASG